MCKEHDSIDISLSHTNKLGQVMNSKEEVFRIKGNEGWPRSPDSTWTYNELVFTKQEFLKIQDAFERYMKCLSKRHLIRCNLPEISSSNGVRKKQIEITFIERADHLRYDIESFKTSPVEKVYSRIKRELSKCPVGFICHGVNRVTGKPSAGDFLQKWPSWCPNGTICHGKNMVTAKPRPTPKLLFLQNKTTQHNDGIKRDATNVRSEKKLTMNVLFRIRRNIEAVKSMNSSTSDQVSALNSGDIKMVNVQFKDSKRNIQDALKWISPRKFFRRSRIPESLIVLSKSMSALSNFRYT